MHNATGRIMHVMSFKKSAMVTLALAAMLGLTITGVATARHAYPKSAPMAKISFVPAYLQATDTGGTCNAPFTTTYQHDTTLTNASCAPTIPLSQALTTGTKNGPFGARYDGVPGTYAPQMTSSAVIQYCGAVAGSGICSIPSSAPDVAVTVNITDVRCRVTGSGTGGGCGAVLGGYTGGLLVRADLRITDHVNKDNIAPIDTCSATSACTATMEDTTFTVPITPSVGGGCTPAGTDPAIGSTCAVSTSVNTFAPGVVVGGKKGNTELTNIGVWDPGTDFNFSTGSPPIEPYLKQGLFIP